MWSVCSTRVYINLSEQQQSMSASRKKPAALPITTFSPKEVDWVKKKNCHDKQRAFSFSQLKLIKPSRRSTISISVLSELALMKINHDHCEKLTSPEELQSL